MRTTTNASRNERTYRLVLALVRAVLRATTRTQRNGLSNIPRTGPVLIAGNHISVADPLVLATAIAAAGRRPRAMATAGLFNAPILGTQLRRAGFIPVHRRSPNPAAALAPAAAALHAGQAVMLYPEGKITTDPNYWPMPARTGIVRLALDSGAPVIPAAQWGVQELVGRGGRPVAVLRAALRRPHVALTFGTPVDLREVIGVTCAADATAEQLRDGANVVMAAVERLLVDLRGASRPGPHEPSRQPCPPGAARLGLSWPARTS